jgi:hypothetical protein
MEDRRKSQRYVASFAVALESQGRYIFSTRARDVASTGLLVMMAAELEVGEPVVITYSVEGGDVQYHDVEGRIVRVTENTGDGKSEWPYLAAVEFSGPLPELDDLLNPVPEDVER